MSQNKNEETICALATPNGLGAIGVIRVSGSKSFEIVSKLFSKDLSGLKSHTIHFGSISSVGGELIDEVLVSVFKDGRSFTGEESVEVSCHGSPYIQKEIIKSLIQSGARMASPGEFTLRAFLNGKIDLSQAEAVADLIASESQKAHQIALNQLKGNFSSELKELREKLINFASLVELELDFGEEDVEFANRDDLEGLVEDVLKYLKRLVKSFDLGNAIKKGVPVAIVGAPNTGKSTLLNQLLGDDRAIVSDIKGTTRDSIEETINIDGILFRLIDTAGIREGAEEIEAIGIERSLEKIKQASIVLCIADASNKSNVNEVSLWVEKLKKEDPGKNVLMVLNKIDISKQRIKDAVCLSAKTGENISKLKELLVSEVQGEFKLGDETIVSNSRHYQSLTKTIESLEKTKESLTSGVSGDFVAMDIRQAMFHLGSITNDISTDDLLGNIFSNFCIGK